MANRIKSELALKKRVGVIGGNYPDAVSLKNAERLGELIAQNGYILVSGTQIVDQPIKPFGVIFIHLYEQLGMVALIVLRNHIIVDPGNTMADIYDIIFYVFIPLQLPFDLSGNFLGLINCCAFGCIDVDDKLRLFSLGEETDAH